MKKLIPILLVALLLAVGLALSPAEPAGACEPCRMTGGGTIDGTKVRHGYQLHCDVTQVPNRLEVNWGKGDRFHLMELLEVECFYDTDIGPPDPPTADCNTYHGWGTGRYRGTDGYYAEWIFTDVGQPGVNDWAWIEITDAGGNVVLDVEGYLHHGNQQFHNCTGKDLR